MIEEIMLGISAFPPSLSLEDQGLFAIGYYHQRNAIFQKTRNKEED
jgi:CRISPR-associated protein Csd1